MGSKSISKVKIREMVVVVVPVMQAECIEVGSPIYKSSSRFIISFTVH
jgi:hypothetical protein